MFTAYIPNMGEKKCLGMEWFGGLRQGHFISINFQLVGTMTQNRAQEILVNTSEAKLFIMKYKMNLSDNPYCFSVMNFKYTNK